MAGCGETVGIAHSISVVPATSEVVDRPCVDRGALNPMKHFSWGITHVLVL
jgi:hypothetical protein